MINLIEVKDITDDLIQEFKLLKEDHFFECYLDNIKIGYAIIRKDPTDKLFLIVAKKYQNKGYGSDIFKLLLSKVNETVTCSVPIDNVKMQRIIQKNNGIEIGRNGEKTFYNISKNDNI